MRMLSATTLVVCAAALAGCAARPELDPPSLEKYNVSREKFLSDKTFRDDQIKRCFSTIHNNDSLAKTYGLMLNVPKERAAKLVCERLAKSIIDGRYDYSIYSSMSYGRPTPKFIRIIQGR